MDLCLVAVLANLGGKVLFAGLLGVSFFWFAGRKLGKGGTFFSRTARMALRGVGALLLFIAAASLFNRAEDSVEAVVRDDDAAAPAAAATGVATQRSSMATGFTAVRMAANLMAVQNAPDSAHAFKAARAAVVQMRRLGMTDAQVRDALRGAEKEHGAKPYVAAAYRAAMPAAAPGDSAESEANKELPPDSLAALYAAAVHDHDSTRVAVLGPRLASALARDSLDEMQAQVSRLENEKRELSDQVKKEEKRGLLATLLQFFDDLGIGFGWIGLYFTAFTALWKGQTPGKKLFGIRVLRLDGVPMTLWASFERFGGYAAGLFTGLMGYAQVFWDRNRQAIQDKISETVVIRVLPGAPVPVAPAAPWAGYPLPPRPAPLAGMPYPPPSSPPPAGPGR